MNTTRAAVLGFAVLLSACASTSSAPLSAGPGRDDADINAFLSEWHIAPASPAAFTDFCNQAEARARALKERIEAGGPSTIEAAFAPYDALNRVLGSAAGEANLVAETNPSAAIRAAGEECLQRLSALGTELSLSQGVYRRLSAIDLAGADPDTRHALTRLLGDYRRAGVDRDDATRARIEELSNQITDISLEFSRNIRDDVDEVTFRSAADLAGVPQDYLASHRPGPDGLIRVNTNTPDVFPILNYASNEATRRSVYTAYRNRAYPENEPVLRRLVEKRYELARILNEDTFADLVTANMMTGDGARAQRFLDELAAAARPAAQRDYARLLARLRREQPRANAVPQWSTAFTQGMIQREEYALDSQEVRRYFAYNNVRDGIFQLMTDLFGVEIRPWRNAPIYHESVEAFEMWDQGRLIGRFMLDNHPREGKFNHAAHFQTRYGSADGSAVPMGVLVQNFPAGDHTTGLMEHSQVETFLHEFGHLIHHIFSGRQRWTQLNYGGGENDFIEAPSSFLEEWIWDYDTLSRFAVNAEGQTIPRDLVERMNRARSFGQSMATLVQLGYAGVSLNYYNRDPAGMDFETLYEQTWNRYAVTPLAPNTHHYAQFGHLTGYSAIVYTYEWSQTIAYDLFTQFEANGLRDRATADRYRRLVLQPGSSKPADTLIRDFLGRPWTLDAYRRRLAQ